MTMKPDRFTGRVVLLIVLLIVAQGVIVSLEPLMPWVIVLVVVGGGATITVLVLSRRRW
ncbi:hypothetical protein [Streptomyces spiramyceticus]|uniref:hypothetical protein n=1 Tax=Streptomyces spiramyceticus TaxID=299717 RepID=UPI00237B0021|nr:hypothetical protein [Streptomyces spiramyceticus]